MSKLGEAARYILRHYDKLIRYLTDPRLSPSNDFSERMLRMEMLIQANSLFRQTLDGRFSLDIMRTILQTSIASKAIPSAYLRWVMKADPDAVESSPEKYLPRSFVKQS